MKTIHLFLIALLGATLPLQAQMKVTRSSALTGAKNLTVTTTGGQTYHYLVSSNDSPMVRFAADSIYIEKDGFKKAEVTSLRFKSLPRLLLNEDSTTFDKTATLDHGLLALRCNLTLTGWNSLVLPISITGRQLTDAFGEGTLLAGIKGINEEDATIVDFQTIDIVDDEIAIKANNHYLILPTKEADVDSNHTLYGFATKRVPGPIYLIPNVSMKVNQTARYQTIKSADEQTQVRFRGTYLTLDGSSTKNKKVAPGAYTLNDDTQLFALNEDSATVKAFHSWATDISAEPKPLKFYIDGVELTDGIVAPQSDLGAKNKEDWATYDLSGRRVVSPQRGIYITRGRKIYIK